MSVADRIGLFPGFGWVAGHPFWVTLLICWAVTPGMMILVGIIGESRLIPLSPNKQYLSFFPGDLLLGTGVASLLVAAQRLPIEERWYNATVTQIVLLIGAAAIAVVMTAMELKGGVYSLRAILSPTKLYHNGVLYAGYGYVAGASLIAVLAGSNWSKQQLLWVVLAAISTAIWCMLVVADNSLVARSKAQYAHVADWRPFWS